MRTGKKVYILYFVSIIVIVICLCGNSKSSSFFDVLFDSLEEEEVPTVAPTIIPKPDGSNIELNVIQSLFASLNSDTTREYIDEYIEANHLVKYAFTKNSGYYIGFDYDAIKQRNRDRVGEAVDINFTTYSLSSNIPEGMVTSADYAIHTKDNTKYVLRYENGKFYLNGIECESGDAAMQQFLKME